MSKKRKRKKKTKEIIRRKIHGVRKKFKMSKKKSQKIEHVENGKGTKF